ncbi:hypothetical protein EDF35_3045 [Rathayibacter sp. PhB151]|uniref:hypothetical protein n=1 Tax=Rathayibacter sp. PhB151 TaxID=2485189 RepID=UPI001063DAFA|nr:hypothetical protein [Rathayibacter sp. PhB151]TDX77530.1 hypothetical protein EDF35_3045 [Rathayibacter sp. PhB151]
MADSSRTDPRFHAAYQRGYQGPAPEVRRREEEAYRRPRRASGRVQRADPSPRVESAEPESPLAGLSFVPDPADVEAAEDRSVAEERPAATPAVVRPLGRRVPLTLAVAGLVLIPLGLAALWWSTLASYTNNVVYERLEPEQYLRMLLGFVASPALTVGLLALAAAVVLQAVRRSRA